MRQRLTHPLVLSLTLLALSTSPASADDPDHDLESGSGQVLTGGIVGAGGALVGLMAGATLAFQTKGNTFGLVLAVAVSNLTTGLALEGYGALAGHNGSALAASAASLGVQALGAAALLQGGEPTTIFVVTLLSQGLVASVVYSLTGEDEPTSSAQSGALLRYDPAHGLSVGAPTGAITPDAEGGYTPWG